MRQADIKRPDRGRPLLRPGRVAGNKGFSFPHTRRHLRQRSVRITITRFSSQHRGSLVDQAIHLAQSSRARDQLDEARTAASNPLGIVGWEAPSHAADRSDPAPAANCQI